jgi:non-specific serine/threonine protein kinase
VELAAVLDGLTDHRLVTLTGAGGSGKTRLALQAAAGLLESSRDGVWFVDLTPVNDETRAPAQLADVLGLGERPGKPLDESVAEWLRAHEVLLVFDNCEHLVQGVAAFVDDVLRTCPAVRVLATSREALGVRGELVLPVPPLSLDGEAAALFVTRAMTAVPGLRSSDLDAELVDQVCRRLDGLPLAIELAAARLRSLSQAELAARLDDRFQLLTGGSRTAPSRQRTLEAVVAWGYDLLSADERALFRAVSIFPDSFDLDAAAAVSDGNPLDALDTVARLLDKSFLVKTTTDSGSSRYHLLETLRHYGRDRLRESDEFEARRNDLLAWAMGLVARLERDLLTPAMDAAIAAVMADRANLRVAMEFAMEREDFTAALRIVTAVPADLTGRRRALIVDLLDRGSEQHGDQVVAKSQQTLADLAFEQGDWQQAAQAYEAAWVGFEALGDRRRALWSKHGYCSARWALGDTDVARRLNRECLAELRTLGDEYGIAQTVWLASLLEPDRSTATSLAVEAEGRYTELGSPIMRAHALEARGLIALADGDVDAATAPLREAIAVLAGATNLGCTAHLLEAVAVWASLQGEMEAAGEFVGSAESLRAASGAGHKPWEVRALHGEDFDLRVMGDDDAAHDAARRGRLLSLAAAAELADSALGRATDLARESRREGAGGPR